MTCRTCGRRRLAHLRHWVGCPAARNAVGLCSPSREFLGTCRCGRCRPGAGLRRLQLTTAAPLAIGGVGTIVHGADSYSAGVFLVAALAWLALGQAADRRDAIRVTTR